MSKYVLPSVCKFAPRTRFSHALVHSLGNCRRSERTWRLNVTSLFGFGGWFFIVSISDVEDEGDVAFFSSDSVST